MTKQLRPTILQLLQFINKFSFERGMQWTIPNVYQQKIIYEICWIHDKTTDLNWYFKEFATNQWHNVTAEDLIHKITTLKLDLVEFEIQLLKDICVQAVCSHLFIEKAAELIGQDKIDSSIQLLKEITEKKSEVEQEAKTTKSTKVAKKTKIKNNNLKLVKKSKKDE